MEPHFPHWIPKEPHGAQSPHCSLEEPDGAPLPPVDPRGALWSPNCPVEPSGAPCYPTPLTSRMEPHSPQWRQVFTVHPMQEVDCTNRGPWSPILPVGPHGAEWSSMHPEGAPWGPILPVEPHGAEWSPIASGGAQWRQVFVQSISRRGWTAQKLSNVFENSQTSGPSQISTSTRVRLGVAASVSNICDTFIPLWCVPRRDLSLPF